MEPWRINNLLPLPLSIIVVAVAVVAVVVSRKPLEKGILLTAWFPEFFTILDRNSERRCQ